MSPVLVGLTLAAAIGSGLIAGIFFAFSSFVMPALARLPVPQGIAAMQSINRTVITPSFMALFLGTPLLSVGLVAYGGWRFGSPGAGWWLAGGLLAVIGCFGVTLAANVPLNDALAREEAGGDAAAALWTRYLRRWTAWNTVRTVASLLAAVAFTLALVGSR